MMVCNNLIDSLQPITQGNKSSRPTAFFKVKILKNWLFCFPYLSNYAARVKSIYLMWKNKLFGRSQAKTVKNYKIWHAQFFPNKNIIAMKTVALM